MARPQARRNKGEGWVSACLFARVNANDIAEAISLRGTQRRPRGVGKTSRRCTRSKRARSTATCSSTIDGSRPMTRARLERVLACEGEGRDGDRRLRVTAPSRDCSGCSNPQRRRCTPTCELRATQAICRDFTPAMSPATSTSRLRRRLQPVRPYDCGRRRGWQLSRAATSTIGEGHGSGHEVRRGHHDVRRSVMLV